MEDKVKITSIAEIGKLVRQRRKADHIDQQTAANLCNVGRRFLSELENGKETLEIGKVLHVLTMFGFDVEIKPR